MNNILVTGSAGFIGYHISQVFTNYILIGLDQESYKNNAYSQIYTGCITNTKLIANIMDKHNIDIVIHTAAIKSIKECEQDKSKAEQINVNATKEILKLARKHNARFIYISSDQVFNGKEGNYKEQAQLEPINYYGTTKMRCEKIVAEYDKGVICRTSMVFGLIPPNQKNVLKEIVTQETLIVQGFIIQHVLARLKENKQIYLPNDEFMNPTSGNLLARQLVAVITHNVSGIIHCCGSERISRFNFGIQIANKYNLDKTLIKSIIGNDPLRPKDVSLESSFTQKKLNMKFDNINEMLSDIGDEV
ncbi:MAG: SDR family oxidoreductase [Candidatus Woesearchaeota archaeon]